MRIRNWKTFQHYQLRNPPWIKLYREILDDKQWHELSGDSAKGLIMLWLIASENDGNLPDSTTLAFRLRISENRVNALLSDCSHWLEGDASTMLADRYHDAMPETETEKSREETEAKIVRFSTPLFSAFMKAYPTAGAYNDRETFRAWARIGAEGIAAQILASLEEWKQCKRWTDGFVVNSDKFLMERYWEKHPPKKVSKNEARAKKNKETIARVLKTYGTVDG